MGYDRIYDQQHGVFCVSEKKWWNFCLKWYIPQWAKTGSIFWPQINQAKLEGRLRLHGMNVVRNYWKFPWFFWVCLEICYPKIPFVNRRKFRSETSDNMDSWKAEVRRVRREKIRRKKMQVREEVGTSWNTESRDSLCFSNDLWRRRVEK